MAQTPVDNTQASLALTQGFVTSGVFPSHDGAGGAFLDEIFTYAFNFAPGGTIGANGQLLSINQNQAVFSLIGTTYGGNGTTNFAIPNLGGVTMIGTGQGPGLSPEQLGVRDGASSVMLTRDELPPDLGGTSQAFSNYQLSLPVTYMICVEGIFPGQGGGNASQDMMGEVMPFAGNFVPADYLPADGRLLQIGQNTALFSLIGTIYGGDGMTTFALPDLRGRTIIGASSAPVGPFLGETIGSPTVSLSNNQAPDGISNTVQPFDNREPSLALNYLISLNGIFPSQGGGGSVNPDTPYLGEVMAFAGNFAPSGWALANGQLVGISQNTALFALLGTTYGGDGVTTFALPDLRGRTVIGTGSGVTIGSQPGANFPTVTAAELPTAFALSTFQLAAFGASAGGWSSDDTYPRKLADVNGVSGGSGMTDIVGFSSAGVYVSLATGGGHFAMPTFELAAFGVDAGGWSSDDIYPRKLADVSGDTRADIVAFSSAGVYESLATAGGHFAAPTFELAAFGANAGGWSSDDTYPRKLADVNGDGKADIIGFSSAGVYESLATAGGHFAMPTSELAAFGTMAGGWSSDNTYPRELADVNGDGSADIVGFGQAGVYVSLATGGGHFAMPTFELAAFGAGAGAGGWTSQDLYPRTLADVNADGKADIVGFGADGVSVSLATGGGHFASPTFQLSAFGANAGGWSSDNTFPRQLADISGNGSADIIAFASNGVWTAPSLT
jgi:microcystin-dependent protein